MHPVLVVGVRDVIGGVVGMVVGGVVGGGRAGAGIRDVTGGVAPRCWTGRRRGRRGCMRRCRRGASLVTDDPYTIIVYIRNVDSS